DFVRRWSEKTEIRVGRFPQWLGMGASKFYDWRQRYGRVNEQNGWIPPPGDFCGWRGGRCCRRARFSRMRSRREPKALTMQPRKYRRHKIMAGILSKDLARPRRKRLIPQVCEVLTRHNRNRCIPKGKDHQMP